MHIGWLIAAYLLIGFLVVILGGILMESWNDDEAGALLIMFLLFWPVLFIAATIKSITYIPKAVKITFEIIKGWFKGD
ncbi:MAG: hypothetical protein J6Y02_17585 [Pseudobutyrivibrio sp.]|nr:hypothetical protein [Pseudobutyrivibrio sp.]